MLKTTFEAIEQGNAPKGDVLGTARASGNYGGETNFLFNSPLPSLTPAKNQCSDYPESRVTRLRNSAEVVTKSETGVEMEALTAVSVAALTLYDMAKALEKSILIENIRLLSKTGGKSDYAQGFPCCHENPGASHIYRNTDNQQLSVTFK
jgi:cyclic pyranopterin phosphate synthase